MYLQFISMCARPPWRIQIYGDRGDPRRFKSSGGIRKALLLTARGSDSCDDGGLRGVVSGMLNPMVVFPSDEPAGSMCRDEPFLPNSSA
jgi:hypothetical protein